ncbi:hypothetical protein NLX83_19570 [Allokutzneria sp. A3M-2-11 16]|uniref:hypothetical protein n=1 Tax=Allokutzneria sp. A3M-2-11 16 TaxID=2962043 RepID=UPI0020B8E061|nr:hypothetical protein [Allokutzneria sp. A3M-2-11 16]MCP3801461.1 hypothetical protein [Allokutzneria sp. A3M-2-11 16]
MGWFCLDLTWDHVDPHRHQFDSSSALAVISQLEPAGYQPPRPTGSPADWADLDWGEDRDRWCSAMHEAIRTRFGIWAIGWSWGEIDGGPVAAWSGLSRSVTTTAETLPRIAEALCEWRAWLEHLAELFDSFALDELPEEEREGTWARAFVHLINLVSDRVPDDYSSDPHAHCEQVLRWFLTRWGVPPERAWTLVTDAVDMWWAKRGTSFRELVQDIAENLAIAVEIDRM